MAFSVKRKSSGLVRPSEPAKHEILTLSAIDRVPGLRHSVRSIHVFRNGDRAAKMIKAAVSKVLVYFPSFAGRFVSDAGEVKLACGGDCDGAWFVEAQADCMLKDVKFLDHPLMLPPHDLLPTADSSPDTEPIDLPFMMQVTEFKCGGFAVGLVSVHTLADGQGMVQFLKAIGEMARGLPKPTVTPLWARDVIPNPPKKPQVGPLPSLPPSLKLQDATLDFSSATILQLKSNFFRSTGKYCSSFDASVAMAWQARTRAVGFRHDEMIRVCFFASTRHLLSGRLPGGFYGNCFYPVKVCAAAGIVADSTLVDVVRLIREGKKGLSQDFDRWAVGDFGEEGDPFELTFSYSSLFVSDWTKLGFMEVDYGWGLPSSVIPFPYSEYMAVAIIGAPPAPEPGVRIMTQCVKEEHLEAFRHEMTTFALTMTSDDLK